MSGLNPEKLTVDYMEGVTKKGPLIPRCYTLTHSDTTGDLYLQIGREFAYDKITPMRDDVLGEWLYGDGFWFQVYLHMNKSGEKGMESSKESFREGLFREEIFRRELPLALQAIRYGDREFFSYHPEMDLYPIIVYFLYHNPELNKAENWGSFADYVLIPPSATNGEDITTQDSGNECRNESGGMQTDSFEMEYDMLVDEVMGDVNGDGIKERINLYGNKEAGSSLIHSIVIKAESMVEENKSEWFGWDIMTEQNGYNPTLFLGDFTNNHKQDILFTIDLGFDAMNSQDKGNYHASIMSFREDSLENIFTSKMYNTEYSFMAEFDDYYKIRVWSVRRNQLFFLDISYKGKAYLSMYYNEGGKLLKSVQSIVHEANPILPIVSNLNEKTYDLLALHPITGSSKEDILGYLSNLLQYNGEDFVIVQSLVSAPGTYLIPPKAW